jgi:hypothetical protein
MQVDVSEENENAEEEAYIVENPTLVNEQVCQNQNTRLLCLTHFIIPLMLSIP